MVYEGQDIKKPDVFGFDVDGNLTNISAHAARLASVTDRLGLSLSTAFSRTLNFANDAYRFTGLKVEFVESLKRTVLAKLGTEKNGTFDSLMYIHDSTRCAAVSNSPRQWGTRTLDRENLSPFFEQIYFREDIGCLKPDPRALLPVLEANQDVLGERGTVWFLGDRGTDMQLAFNADDLHAHEIIPIAIEGTPAADYLRRKEVEGRTSYIFASIDDIARLFDPSVERRLASTMAIVSHRVPKIAHIDLHPVIRL